MNDEINRLIDELKFKGMAGVIDQQVALAESGSSVQDIICNLLREELRYRQERSLINRIRNARMPWDWTLNSFPFEQQPGVNKNQVMTLAGLDFLQRGENIIFHGKTGVGKSGLAVGILRQALISGSRGRFYDVQHLLDDLYASLADRSTTKLLRIRP
jgi:DNA replication protein DnaC